MMKSLTPWLLLLFVAAGTAPALAQGAVSVDDLEKEAQKLYEEAQKLQKDNKLVEAADIYRKILTEYRILFFLDRLNEDEVKGRLKACGLAVVTSQLKDLKLYKKRHIDSIYGLEFKPPIGWRGIPPQKKETTEDEWSRGYSYPISRPGLYFFPYLNELKLIVWKFEKADTLRDLESQMDKYLRGRARDLSASRSKPIRMGYPASAREYTAKQSGDRIYVIHLWQEQGRQGVAVAMVWDGIGKEDTTSGSGTTTLDTRSAWETVKKLNGLVASKFFIVPKGQIRAHRKKWNNGALCAGWKTYRTRKYHIEYSTDDAFARKLGAELELIRKVYEKAIPTKNKVPMCVVKAFANAEDFYAYSGAYGAAAYWSPRQEEIVCYKFKGGKVKTDTKEEKEITDKEEAINVTFKIIYHEGFHQYMHYVMGHERMIYIPSWLNEGLGDYFFGGKVVGKKFHIGLNDWRQETIYNAVKEDKHVPLAAIFDYEQRDYYTNAGLCYAEGWAISHWLLNSKNKAYRKFPSLLIDTLRKESDFRKATAACKRALNLDYEKMEEEWKQYVLTKFKPPEKEDP